VAKIGSYRERAPGPPYAATAAAPIVETAPVAAAATTRQRDIGFGWPFIRLSLSGDSLKGRA
jgi:hypothetical protein